MHMANWQWPEGAAVMIHHWTWADGVDDDGMPNLISGWSQTSAPDERNYVHLEAEYAGDELLAAQTLWVDPDGLPARKAYTFRAAAGLPPELLDPDGLPVAWLRELLDARAGRGGVGS
jgi:hypothetical protein